jgi:hypothetical protein
MDIHEIAGGVAMDDVAKAHVADLQNRALRRAVPEVLGRRTRGACLLPRRGSVTGRAAEVHRQAHGLVAEHIYRVQEGSKRSKRVRRMRLITLGGLAAAAVAVGLPMLPAQAQVSLLPPHGGGTYAPTTTVSGRPDPAMTMSAGPLALQLAGQLAAAREAAAKYTTNRSKAKTATGSSRR